MMAAVQFSTSTVTFRRIWKLILNQSKIHLRGHRMQRGSSVRRATHDPTLVPLRIHWSVQDAHHGDRKTSASVERNCSSKIYRIYPALYRNVNYIEEDCAWRGSIIGEKMKHHFFDFNRKKLTNSQFNQRNTRSFGSGTASHFLSNDVNLAVTGLEITCQ